jgi:hypothetical protein
MQTFSKLRLSPVGAVWRRTLIPRSGEFFKGMNNARASGSVCQIRQRLVLHTHGGRGTTAIRALTQVRHSAFARPEGSPLGRRLAPATYASDREPGGPDYSVAQTLRSAHEDRGARGDGRPVAEQDNSWDSTALRLAEGAAHSHQRLPQVHCYVDTETVPRVAVETHSQAFATRTFVLLPVGVVLGTCLGNADLRRRELRRHRMRAMVGR